MLTVAEAARRAGKNPETIRRWIRAGKLPSRRIGMQHLIDEGDLDDVLSDGGWESLPLPPEWGKYTFEGGRHPDWAKIIRKSREAR